MHYHKPFQTISCEYMNSFGPFKECFIPFYSASYTFHKYLISKGIHEHFTHNQINNSSNKKQNLHLVKSFG